MTIIEAVASITAANRRIKRMLPDYIAANGDEAVAFDALPRIAGELADIADWLREAREATRRDEA